LQIAIPQSASNTLKPPNVENLANKGSVLPFLSPSDPIGNDSKSQHGAKSGYDAWKDNPESLIKLRLRDKEGGLRLLVDQRRPLVEGIGIILCQALLTGLASYAKMNGMNFAISASHMFLPPYKLISYLKWEVEALFASN
jgi:hypothetical protein